MVFCPNLQTFLPPNITLKIYKEAIKFSFTGTSVKVLATGIQNSTDESNSEKMLRRVSELGEPSGLTPNEVKE